MPIASLQRGKTPLPNEYPGYDTKPSYGEAYGSRAKGNVEYPFINITPRFIQNPSDSTC